ncbi:MAG: DUF4325 domain-containing protein [Spirochaetota bacterium]
MTVNMVEFGDILISRPAGREALLAAKAYLFTENAGLDSIILDFKGVKVLAPSWGDEFVTGLKSLYKNHIEAANIDSPAMKAALRVVLP